MGPLAGVRVVEVSSIGPGPFCGMMLADMGADVIAVDRDTRARASEEPLDRNRYRLALDLKSDAGREALLQLIDRADVVFEGYRPGVAERLGFGPEVCLQRNPRLVYGRMTGWGQHGPLAKAAGHDINYIALSGVLHAIGRRDQKPTPPLNLIGDFGGGGMLLAFGIMCALFEAQRSGRGQVVDAAMVDGSIALMAMCIGMQQRGVSTDKVGTHLFSGAAHYYDTYETRDGKFISIGALEPQFYALLIEKAGLDPQTFGAAGMAGPVGLDARVWADMKTRMADVFLQRTRDEWCALLEGTDACFAPVLTLSEAPGHPHHQAREAFVKVAGRIQNAPAPRFSRTPAAAPRSSRADRGELETLLGRWGYASADARRILAAGT